MRGIARNWRSGCMARWREDEYTTQMQGAGYIMGKYALMVFRHRRPDRSCVVLHTCRDGGGLGVVAGQMRKWHVVQVRGVFGPEEGDLWRDVYFQPDGGADGVGFAAP